MGSRGRRESAARGGRVLVVDDDQAMCSALLDGLVAEGFTAFAESDADQVLSAVGTHHPHVVVLDLEMPQRGGLDLLGDIKLHHPATAVIVITAFGGPRVAQRALRLGASAYLDKPFRVADLLDRVRRSLGPLERISDRTA